MRLTAACLTVFLVASAEGAERSLDVVSEALAATTLSGMARSIVGGAEVAIPVAMGGAEVHQTNPVIASDGESFLIVWRESTECCFWKENQQTTGELYTARLNSRGERIGQPLLISSIATTSTPAITFDGTNYLLAWGEFGPLGMRVVAQRFSPDLRPVEPTPFIIFNPVPSPDMRIGSACGPDDCLIIFEDGHALVSKTGGVLSLSLRTGGLKNAVIPTESGYVATMMIRQQWSGPIMPPVPPTDANHIAEFSRDGTVAGPFEFGYLSGYSNEQIGASLATNGSSILIAAVDSNYEHPRLVRPPLYVTPVPAKISSVPFAPRFYVDVGNIDGRQPWISDPQVIWTGKRYLLVYQRSNESFTHRILPSKADIWGVWIDPDGSGTPGSPFDLTATEQFESLPAITVNARGLMALAFVRGRGGEDSPNPRLFVKTLSDGGGRSRPARR